MAAIVLLGEVTAHVGGRPVNLGPARQRCVLAALAVDTGRVVTLDRLAERVWTFDVAQQRRASLHTYLSRLRQTLAGDGGADIVRRSGGYALLAGHTDLEQFRELSSRARDGVDDLRAEQLLSEALDLWRGDALAGLESEWAQAERERLHQERSAAEHAITDIRLRLGRGEELLATLSQRVSADPLDELLAGQYMLALYRAGRTADALAHYQRVRARLITELGTDPGPALHDLHQQILGSHPALTGVLSTAATVTNPTPVPRQLPAAPLPFVGRHHELDQLDAAQQDTPGGTTVVISAIAGAGGIGKTWLALHWAYRYLEKFTDGHLFVDLLGFSPEAQPMPPTVALRGFLDALGIEPDRIPLDVHAQSALFRSLVAGKRMLVVLDNAAGTAQVTPLLPGSDTCTVVVTSRHQLPGLITGHSAQPLLLDVLSDAEARKLLTERLGASRIDAEPTAVAELIKLCGGFPLALSIIAGHARTHPHLLLAELAAELRDVALDALASDDPTASLPAVLSWSQHALAPEQLRMFTLLGIAPGPDIGLPAASSLAGQPERATRAMLRGLEQASLVAEPAAGRYRMHELVRQHASHQELHDAERNAALRRITDFYLHTAYAADQVLAPERQSLELAPPATGWTPQHFPDHAAALAWLTEQQPHLLATHHAAAARRWHQDVWQLAWTMNTLHHRRGLLQDELAVWGLGLAAADHVGEPSIRILALRMLGRVLYELDRGDEATERLHQALALAEQSGDRTAEAYVRGNLLTLLERRGEYQQAFDHGTRVLNLFRALGNPVRETQSLSNLGWFAARLGRFEDARHYCETALALYRRLGDRDGEAYVLDSLGYIERQDEQLARALDYYRQSVAVRREVGDSYQTANTLDDLGLTHLALGQPGKAHAVWQEALELYRTQQRFDAAERVQQRIDGLPG